VRSGRIYGAEGTTRRTSSVPSAVEESLLALLCRSARLHEAERQAVKCLSSDPVTPRLFFPRRVNELDMATWYKSQSIEIVLLNIVKISGRINSNGRAVALILF
jgi:hypothetical protein